MEDITIKDLYPNLNEEQLKEAEENLDRYIEVCRRIFKRLENDPEAYAEFKRLVAEQKRGNSIEAKEFESNTGSV